jgi:hypothetical protein
MRVNLERFVDVAVAEVVVVFVDVVDVEVEVEVDVVSETAFVFAQFVTITALAGPKYSTGLQPGSWSNVPKIGSGKGFAVMSKEWREILKEHAFCSSSEFSVVLNTGQSSAAPEDALQTFNASWRMSTFHPFWKSPWSP